MYLGNANRGVKILTVGMEACSDKHIKQYSVKYALNGYLSDYFDIGKPTGEITLSGVPVIVRLYLFTVSAFVDITYKSGAKVQNFTETSVRIQVHGKCVWGGVVWGCEGGRQGERELVLKQVDTYTHTYIRIHTCTHAHTRARHIPSLLCRWCYSESNSVQIRHSS